MARPYTPYTFSSSATLFDHAKHAVRSIERKGLPDRHSDQPEALIAIVFSAITLEAFINEFGDLAASTWANSPKDPPSIKEMGIALKVLEERRARIQHKYRLAKRILSGQLYDRSTPPYQDFRMLIDLRNAMLHIKHLDLYEMSSTGIDLLAQPPRVITQLEAWNVLADVSEMRPTASWIEKLQCLACARWACAAASSMIGSLIDALPDLRFRGYWQRQQRYYDLSVPPIPR